MSVVTLEINGARIEMDKEQALDNILEALTVAHRGGDTVERNILGELYNAISAEEVKGLVADDIKYDPLMEDHIIEGLRAEIPKAAAATTSTVDHDTMTASDWQRIIEKLDEKRGDEIENFLNSLQGVDKIKTDKELELQAEAEEELRKKEAIREEKLRLMRNAERDKAGYGNW